MAEVQVVCLEIDTSGKTLFGSRLLGEKARKRLQWIVLNLNSMLEHPIRIEFNQKKGFEYQTKKQKTN